jgi:cellulose synthase/poly-beta-1,6-N-acetylglucosamine synthase-like glycosyltransferase
VVAAGGYAHDTVGEDMELVVRMRRQAYEWERKRKKPRGVDTMTWALTAAGAEMEEVIEPPRANRVEFIPDPVAWTEAPESVKTWARQRDRWHRGLADVLIRHKRMLLNPWYGAVGLIAYPYFFFVELIGPIIEAIGMAGLVVGLAFHMINIPFAILFFLLAYGYGCVLSIATLLLEEFSYHRYDTFRSRILMVLMVLVESFGYRQLTVFWRIRGLWNYARGNKSWGKMERRGFATTPATTTAVAVGNKRT